MNIRDAAATLLGLGVLVVAGLVGTAVRATWTPTHTTAALVGGLLILGLTAAGVSHAVGVALADRRQQAAPPSVTVQGAGSQADPVAQQLLLLRLMRESMNVQTQMDRRLPPVRDDMLGDWQVSGYAVPDQPARPAAPRWEDHA